MIDFGDKLKDLRNGRNMTQKELADRLGIDKSLISYYEANSRFPSPEVLIKISRIFRVSTDYLLGLEKTRTIDVSNLNEDEIDSIIRLIEIISRKGWKSSFNIKWGGKCFYMKNRIWFE